MHCSTDLRMLCSAEYPRSCMSVFWGLCMPVVCVIVYICMYGVCLCVCACVHLCMCMCIRECMHLCVYMYVHVCICLSVLSVCARVNVCTCTNAYTCARARVCLCMVSVCVLQWRGTPRGRGTVEARATEPVSAASWVWEGARVSRPPAREQRRCSLIGCGLASQKLRNPAVIW